MPNFAPIVPKFAPIVPAELADCAQIRADRAPELADRAQILVDRVLTSCRSDASSHVVGQRARKPGALDPVGANLGTIGAIRGGVGVGCRVGHRDIARWVRRGPDGQIRRGR
ncbi:hypothetical protein EEB19_19440 [Gordonia sp. OPL2]|nr:hypothetical protein EEB19_19440 [Gordonia sp. OPL2]